ncbi:MAG: 1-acyl-sn-glycerol-3-phosphate acyltransferase [Peptococcaceae bacterium]|nr:1-acyl-sn-glycerol-3-phosphate acyltransferase [Peptococcaceae bacterium]
MNFYSFAKYICSTILKIKGYRVQGLENVPAEGPFIVACNHLSLWDPVIVGCALPRPIIFMAKAELFDIPFVGIIIKGLHAFPVRRGHSDIAAIKKALTVLKNNAVLGIFPEGTRSKTGELQEAMTGVVLIMEKSGAPVLPVKIYGSRGLLKQKRGTMGVIIGKPIYIDKIAVPPDISDRRSWIANKIMKEVDEI